MATEFYLGLDITNDDQATLALVEKATEEPDEATTFAVRRLERIDGFGPAKAVAEYAQDLLVEAPYTGRTILVVNKTDPAGQDVLDALTEQGLTPIGIVLSGSDAATQTDSGLARTSGGDPTEDTSGFMVSEHELVDTAQKLFRSGTLKLSQNESENVSHLAQGLQSYRVRANEAGEALNAIEGTPRRDADHAGFVLSTALACWLGAQRTFNPADYMQEAAETLADK